MNPKEIKKCPSDDWGTREWLEEIYRNYAILTAIATGVPAENECVEFRDIILANEMTQTLIEISNLVEKEQNRK